MTDLILEIGREVREARKAQRLTHEALAQACGVSHSRIEALEERPRDRHVPGQRSGHPPAPKPDAEGRPPRSRRHGGRRVTVLFRPCGDLQRAPRPRSEADLALRARIEAATGLAIAHDHGEPVDYEDWTEPMCLLDAALAAGREVLVLPRERLAEAVAAPVLRIPGEPGPLVLLGRRTRHDDRDADAVGLIWPPRDHMLAGRYAELDAFHANAGRATHLANMPGDPVRAGGAPFRRLGTGGSAAEAMARLAGGTCLVKQVIPIKELGIQTFEIPDGATPAQCERMLWDRLEWHAVHYEGLRDCLLVQGMFP